MTQDWTTEQLCKEGFTGRWRIPSSNGGGPPGVWSWWEGQRQKEPGSVSWASPHCPRLSQLRLQVRKDDGHWVEEEVFLRTQRLRWPWNSPQQPINTERKTGSAFSDHCHLQGTDCRPERDCPSGEVGNCNGKDGPAETSLCLLLGWPAGPSYSSSPRVSRKKARMEDGVLETVRRLRGHASLIQILTLLREKVMASLLGRNKRFFSQ